MRKFLETGIKIIDILDSSGNVVGKAGLFGGRSGEAVLIIGNDPQHGARSPSKGISLFCGSEKEVREGEDLYRDSAKRGALDKTVMVLRSDEQKPPGAPYRCRQRQLLTMAEYFFVMTLTRCLLLLITIIFYRFHSGSPGSLFNGGTAIQVGYQTRPWPLSWRRLRNGSPAPLGGDHLDSRLCYVPADDFTARSRTIRRSPLLHNSAINVAGQPGASILAC